MKKIALKCEGITVTYGALKAIDTVSHSFEEGRIYGLIGPNGAGKTTLLNVLSGHQMRHQGSIHCFEENITRLPPYKRAHIGIGRSFQITKIFPEMTVLDNLRIAAQIRHSRFQPFWIASRYERRLDAEIDSMLELIGLTDKRDETAGTLSYGLQRALELGLTLMPNPRILLLDEPLAGVGHHEIESSTQLIKTAAAGRTVLLIEHNMDAIMQLSEEIVVMSNGKIVAVGSPDSIRQDKKVRAIYLGDETS